MYRKQIDNLNQWIDKGNRKPLILRGARQVGKSTLVRLFAEQLRRPLVEINLERHQDFVDTFQQLNLQGIVNLLDTVSGGTPISPDTLLFMDEIQAIPAAIPALRYFYEEMPELPLLAAGSLMEFTLADHTFSMPVGRVEYLRMGPMCFTEFLEALHQPGLARLIRQYRTGDQIPTPAHRRLLDFLRNYFFIGGMPEAVKVFAQTGRLKDVSEVHNSIIDTYREDLPKYIGSRNMARVRQVFNFAAHHVGKKVKYSQFSETEKSATIKADIDLLCMAQVLRKVAHSHCNGLPVQAESNDRIYKLLCLDVGLMNALVGLNWQSIAQMEQSKLVNEGAIAEQFVGQHLLDMLAGTANQELNYWLREGRSVNAEVDYVLGMNGQIIPIEVKSGAAGALKSLHQFVGDKNVPQAIRFYTSLPAQQQVTTRVRKANSQVEVSYNLLSLPLYLVEALPNLYA